MDTVKFFVGFVTYLLGAAPVLYIMYQTFQPKKGAAKE